MLQKALDVFGLSCQNLDSPECTKSAQHPENEVAFICNLRVSRPVLPLALRDASVLTAPHTGISATSDACQLAFLSRPLYPDSETGL